MGADVPWSSSDPFVAKLALASAATEAETLDAQPNPARKMAMQIANR
jgi:hypothetical protein